jgi:UDP-N-acetylmuramate--alanine ligase
LDKIENPNKKLMSKSELLEEVKNCKTGVLVVLGAGDIGMEVPKIKNILGYAH